MRLRDYLMTILIATTLAGCASKPPVPADSWCATNEPRRPTPEVYQAMDRAAKEDMHAHNSLGVQRCGWKP